MAHGGGASKKRSREQTCAWEFFMQHLKNSPLSAEEDCRSPVFPTSLAVGKFFPLLHQIPAVFSAIVGEVLDVAGVLRKEFLHGIHPMLLEHPGNVRIIKALGAHLPVELFDKRFG